MEDRGEGVKDKRGDFSPTLTSPHGEGITRPF